ncbi:MAG: RidA family protein [Cyanobacteria bacterium P01_F01_bin.150]
MAHTVIQTDQAPAPVGPYNQAIAATGKMVFISGQVALDPATGILVGDGDVEKETVQVMQNLQAVLAAAGATFADVVKTSVFLADMEDFGKVNAIYATYFDEKSAPARACVQVARLPKDVQVEIECIAVLANA